MISRFIKLVLFGLGSLGFSAIGAVPSATAEEQERYETALAPDIADVKTLISTCHKAIGPSKVDTQVLRDAGWSDAEGLWQFKSANGNYFELTRLGSCKTHFWVKNSVPEDFALNRFAETISETIGVQPVEVRGVPTWIKGHLSTIQYLDVTGSSGHFHFVIFNPSLREQLLSGQ
jgi:hypothetical protein